MSARLASAVLTLLVAAPAFVLSPVLFPPAGAPPNAGQRPLFIVLTAIYSLALGLGVAFLAFGWRPMRRLFPDSAGRAAVAYAAVAFLLVSWYPHGGLHGSIGMNKAALLGVEYGFHVPLIVAPLTLIWAFAGQRASVKAPVVHDLAAGST
jgi:hypothetical protein